MLALGMEDSGVLVSLPTGEGGWELLGRDDEEVEEEWARVEDESRMG